MKKIGLLTCSNTTQDMACSSFGCFNDFNRKAGEFARYEKSGGAQMMGIINCAGCPTLRTPEKLLQRVRTLAASGVDAIHMTNCMLLLCPFKKKYKKLLQENYPDIEIIEGSHAPHPELEQMFCDAVEEMTQQPRKTMADLIETALEQSERYTDSI